MNFEIQETGLCDWAKHLQKSFSEYKIIGYIYDGKVIHDFYIACPNKDMTDLLFLYKTIPWYFQLNKLILKHEEGFNILCITVQQISKLK